MKKYNVASWKMEFTNNSLRLEDKLNEYAKQGWQAIPIANNSATIIFRRNKNR